MEARLSGEEYPDHYWIGGSPCSGKSTIAGRLAATYGMRVYRCDDAFFRHQMSIDPKLQPIFSRLARASCDELWMRPVPHQLREAIEPYREQFPFILADLARLPCSLPTIVEGAALLPELVGSLGPDPNRAMWIVPTEQFQREEYERRAWRHEVLSRCSDKDQAWQNWMARDTGFAQVATDQEGRGASRC